MILIRNCGLAVCGLLAATLLSACSGSSSSSAGAGGTGSKTYQQGYAAGTAATLDIVLNDLRALHATLTGSEPAQTSQGTLGRSFASLAPRPRATLAASLLAFISRVQTAQAAAAAPTAGEDEARAAQAAADDALRALQLVITADTADRAGGDEQVQTAAIEALRTITQVDVTDPDARAQVNTALTNALTAAEDRVADLEEELAAAGGRRPGVPGGPSADGHLRLGQGGPLGAAERGVRDQPDDHHRSDGGGNAQGKGSHAHGGGAPKTLGFPSPKFRFGVGTNCCFLERGRFSGKFEWGVQFIRNAPYPGGRPGLS